MIGHNTLQRAPFLPGGTDRLGNTVDQWGPPAPVQVIAWFPQGADGAGGASRAASSARTAVTRTQVILVPPGTASGPRDHWLIDGQTWEQTGHAEDFSGGPFPRTFGGLRIHVTRKEG